MNPMRRICRIVSALVGLAVIWLGLASLPAALAAQASPPGASGPVIAHVTRTVVVVGGTPGWQIALIAVGTALVAAVLAVVADRARTARRIGIKAAA
jgi:hypothetical protein